MKNILKPPCMCCGYDKPDYWLKGTHDKDCPFHRIGGKAKRRNALPYIIRRWAAVTFNYSKSGELK